MDVEPTSLQEFLVRFFEDARVKAITQHWRANPVDLIKIIEGELLEMGIYAVPPLNYARTVMDDVVWRLRHSPNIKQLLIKLEQEESMRANRRRT